MRMQLFCIQELSWWWWVAINKAESSGISQINIQKMFSGYFFFQEKRIVKSEKERTNKQAELF